MIKEAAIALCSMILFVSLASAMDLDPEIHEDVRGVKEIKAKIHPNSEELTFRLIGDPKENKVKK